MPESIFIEINQQCNLNCKHCYNRSALFNSEIQISDFVSILDGIKERKNISLILSGGEPLLHSQFLDILNISFNREFKNIVVVTNGTILKDMLPKIKSYKAIHFQISMDGLEGDKNLRGQYHFDQVKSAVAFLYHNGYKNGELHMVVTRQNIDDIEPFFYYAVENCFFPTYSLIYKSGMAEDDWQQIGLTVNESNIINRKIERIYKNYSNMLPTNVNYDLSELLNRQRYRCPLMKDRHLSNCLIKTNGDVQPCHALYDEVYCVGNAITTPLSMIADPEKNQKFERLLTLFSLRENVLMDSHCQKCHIRDICRGGCPAEAISYSGNFLSIDNNCSYKRSNIALSLIKSVRS